jgi:hypothetical protein
VLLEWHQPKRSRDTNQLAKMIVDLSTADECEEEIISKEKGDKKAV